MIATAINHLYLLKSVCSNLGVYIHHLLSYIYFKDILKEGNL